jgi:hypothetical protein
MSFIIRQIASLVLLCLVCEGSAIAADYVLGIGGAADTEDAMALTAFGDFGIREETWLSASVGTTETNGLIDEFQTISYDVGIDHFFDPVGIRVSGGYWGDSDLLDSADVRASFYFRDDIASLSLDYERRNFDFIFEIPLLDFRREVEFHADGWGMTNRFRFGDNVTLRLSGMHYEYSRRIRIDPNIDALRFLSASRLSLINSLIDYRVNAGIEYKFGLRAVDVTAGTWKTAVDQSKVDSYAIGFLTPLTDRTDIEFRASFDNSENFGRTTALTVYLYYFGGS